jgi:hypothetical protein
MSFPTGRWRTANLAAAAVLLTLLSACDDEIVPYPTDASADRAGDSPGSRGDSSSDADAGLTIDAPDDVEGGD